MNPRCSRRRKMSASSAKPASWATATASIIPGKWPITWPGSARRKRAFRSALFSLPSRGGELRRYAFRLRSCSRKVSVCAESQSEGLQLQRTLAEKMSNHHINQLIVSGRVSGHSNGGNSVVGQSRSGSVLYMDGRNGRFLDGLRAERHWPIIVCSLFLSSGAVGFSVPTSRPPIERPWRPLARGQFQRSFSNCGRAASLQPPTDASDMLVTYSRSLRGQSGNYRLANIALWQSVSLGGPVGTAALGNYAPSAEQSHAIAG